MYSCSHCSREFKTYPALNAHQVKHKPGNEIKTYRNPSKRHAKLVCCIFTREVLSLNTYHSQLKRIKNCEACDKEFKSAQGSRFCSHTCRAKVTNVGRGPRSESTKTKISETLRQDYKPKPKKEPKEKTAPKNLAQILIT